MLRQVLLSVGLLLPAAPLAAQSPILVVDASGGPGADFTSLAAAVAAAPDWAAIVVRAGSYGPVALADKPLVISAAPGETVELVGTAGSDALSVDGLAAGHVLLLEGLALHGEVGFFGARGSTAMRVRNSAGLVWLQGCTLTAGADPLLAAPALDAEGAAQVVAGRCTLRGTGFTHSGESPALRAAWSQVFLYECQLTGGAGEQVSPLGSNAPGARVIGGRLLAEGSTIEGGAALGVENPMGGGCLVSIDGGPGLSLAAGAEVVLFDTAVAGGKANPLVGCAAPGPAQVVESGVVEELPFASLGFAVGSPVPDDGSTPVDVLGQPGDLALAIVGVPGEALWSPPFQGAWTAGAGPALVVLGPLPPSGELHLPADLPDMLPAGTAGVIVVQGAFAPSAGGKPLLADPVALVILDA